MVRSGGVWTELGYEDPQSYTYPWYEILAGLAFFADHGNDR